MKDFALAMALTGLLTMSCIAISKQHELKQLTGNTVTSLQQMKQDCEKDLPRSQQCVIVVSAKAEEE